MTQEKPEKTVEKTEEQNDSESNQQQKTDTSSLGNLVLVGEKNKPGFYARLVKNLFAQNKYEQIEIQGRGESGILRVSQVVSILTRWGYCELVKIKTAPSPSLKVCLKKTADFDDIHADFQKQLEERALERRTKAEAEKATEEAEKATEEAAS